ncbi:MAG: tetratricopeptide repeat protein, partial [Calditrichaeota bacterium]|nr:tetratricopeptide repeat protein [Calditrichota bacterium]
ETESVVLNRIAEMLMNSQQFPEAQRLLLEGLSISEAWHYGHVKSDVLYNLGVIMREQGDRSAALRYLGESLRFGRENGRPATAARALHQMALIVYALGDLDRAANYLNQSIRISREIKDRRTEALKLIDMVNFYLDTRVHQPAVAKSYLNQAIKINVVLRDDEVTRLLNQIAT